MEPKVTKWLQNNWLLYETMAEVADKPIVVDSSKHLLIGLLLQQYNPRDVTIVFLHRSIEGLAGSAKRWAQKKNHDFHLEKVIKSKKQFEKRVEKYKQNISNLQYLDIHYENFTQKPASFLADVIDKMGASKDYQGQSDGNFFIDPSQLHLVAGNPMRYQGRKQVKGDERWKSILTEKESNWIRKSKPLIKPD
jgi:hypothetical protein